MEDFTDGLEVTDIPDTVPETSQEPATETEQTSPPEQGSFSSAPSDLNDTAADQEEAPEQISETPEPEQETEVTSQEETVSYEDLMKALTEQTEEIKAIHELEEKKQEFYTTYQNFGIAFLVGFGLVCGCICTLILANYLRH